MSIFKWPPADELESLTYLLSVTKTSVEPHNPDICRKRRSARTAASPDAGRRHGSSGRSRFAARRPGQTGATGQRPGGNDGTADGQPEPPGPGPRAGGRTRRGDGRPEKSGR